MKNSLRIEEIAMLILSVYLFTLLSLQWWWYLVFFMVPDIGFLGYLFNTKIGAFTYNILHHKAMAIILYLVGIYFKHEIVQFSGIILFGHSAFDRILGYGLKFNDSFNNTHLGVIGKKY